MRKFVWACAAAAVAMASMSLTADYVCRQPGSWVARVFIAGGAVAHRSVLGHNGKDAGRETAARSASAIVTATVAEEGCGDAVAPEGPAVPVPELVELPPARLPGQIVIDEDVPGPQVMPPVRDVVGLPALPGAAEECEVETVPMPRVEPDAPPAMPRVEVDAVCCPKGQAKSSCPECCEPGRCPPCLPKTIKGQDVPAGAEESEPRPGASRMPRLLRDGEKPRHPEVDTMEFRPSDRGFWSDLRGPF